MSCRKRYLPTKKVVYSCRVVDGPTVLCACAWTWFPFLLVLWLVLVGVEGMSQLRRLWLCAVAPDCVCCSCCLRPSVMSSSQFCCVFALQRSSCSRVLSVIRWWASFSRVSVPSACLARIRVSSASASALGRPLGALAWRMLSRAIHAL